MWFVGIGTRVSGIIFCVRRRFSMCSIGIVRVFFVLILSTVAILIMGVVSRIVSRGEMVFFVAVVG